MPPVSYDDLQPYIDRMAQGEPKVLTAEPVLIFEPTSGSTAPIKLIPYTRSLKREFLRAISPWVHDLFKSRPRLVGGPGYWSISPQLDISEKTLGGIPIGFEDDSAYLGFGRWFVASTMAVPREIRFIKNMETFRYVTLLFLLGSDDLRMVSVWNPSFFTFLLEALPNYWNRLLVDLAHGTVAPPSGLEKVPPGVRELFVKRPRRARALESVDPSEPSTIWPRLSLVSCWRDGYASAPADDLAARLRGVEFQGKGLIATEAFVTLPFAGENLLAIRSHFFEFVDEGGKFHLTHELTLGSRYSVVVTTGGGLYRYHLNDTVEVTGFRGSTPALRFLGKSDRTSDLRGEKLSEGFVGGVLARVLAGLSPAPRFAMLAPAATAVPPHYTLYLESEATPGKDLPGLLDRALQENPHYAYCIQLGQLAPSQVILVSEDASEAFFREQLRQGHQAGGAKPSPLSTHSGWSRVFVGIAMESD